MNIKCPTPGRNAKMRLQVTLLPTKINIPAGRIMLNINRFISVNIQIKSIMECIKVDISESK
ncbi:hypothetical protein DCC85_21180 [Paenibacillus sp. CAA11]|nr:hypothetical protein DCC85_21180 [Paenibacillus sp. CAA11]